MSPSPERFAPLDVKALKTLPPAETGLPSFQAEAIASGNYPAGLAVAPDGRIFYTELYGGSIQVIDKHGNVSEWYDVNERFDIQWTEFFHGGLTAITVDPDFASNHYVFAVTQVPNEETGFAETSLILRFTEKNGHGSAPKVLLTLPAAQFDNLYSLVFAPDGTIFVPSGNESHPGVRDTPGDLVGEILHITRDGDPAPGNPFGERAPMTWAYGIRNSFDLAIEPETGYLVGGENSTEGNDEIDLIAPGRFYGWSLYEGIVNSAPRMTQPLLDFGPGHWAPVGMIRYDGARYAKLRGLFLICMNHQPGVYAMRIDPGPPARLLSFTKIAPECSIDITASPDGRIYIADPTTIYELR
jgi:glucose/arabinose dehydrogenase